MLVICFHILSLAVHGRCAIVMITVEKMSKIKMEKVDPCNKTTPFIVSWVEMAGKGRTCIKWHEIVVKVNIL